MGVILTTLLAALNTYGKKAAILVVVAEIAAALVNVGMYLIVFRVLTPKGVPIRQLIPGAVTGGIAWTVLQIVGTYLVHHFLHSNSVYGYFATVLGLVAYINVAVQITVYAAEVNVVLTRGCGPAPWCSRRSPRPTGPAWRSRPCRTSGARSSTSRCPSTTGRRATRSRTAPRRHPRMSPRPHRHRSRNQPHPLPGRIACVRGKERS